MNRMKTFIDARALITASAAVFQKLGEAVF